MTRIVLDTNVLVAAAYAEHSASRRIVEACVRHEIQMVLSPAVQREYDVILARAVRKGDYANRLVALMEGAETAAPIETPRVVLDDPEDDKFLAAAVAGKAEWLVTNDRHLLAVESYGSLRMVPPRVFVAQVLE